MIGKVKEQDIITTARIYQRGLLMQNPPSKSNLEETLKNIRENKCFIYKEEKNIVGLILFKKTKDSITLKFIHATKLRKGIASNLLKKVIAIAKKEKVETIYSSVSSIDKRVLKFYKKFGFTTYAKFYSKNKTPIYKIKLSITKTNTKPKVLLAMSGGVDSSVAALLLKKQGYEIIGAFMKNFSDTKNTLGECAWRAERRYAQKIAAQLDIPLITLDFEKEYKKLVVDVMFKRYKQGITPNPDIDCNEKIKFPLLIKAAKKIGCDVIATGHYARIKKSHEANFELHRAKDETKDQSYFLYRLKQSELKKTLFPVGELTKNQVREIAQKNTFPNYNKKGTVGICFIGKVNLKKFLSKKIPKKTGNILDPEGNVIGKHDGIFYYTIGQRIGPRYGIEIKKSKNTMQKWYVAQKIPKTNTIVAAPEGHNLLLRKKIIIKSPHWINSEPLKNKAPLRGGGWESPREANKISLHARIRQVGELLPCTLSYDKKIKHFVVVLKKGITGVSNGQAIVLYKKTTCLGGGVITF